jgi:carbohydrate binding protein with CBM4/9 domain
MNKKIYTLILGMMITISSLAFAEDNTNLLKNNELQIAENGKLQYWGTWAKCKFNQDTGHKGKNSVRMVLPSGDDITAPSRIVLAQGVGNLKPGKYIFSAYVKVDRKILEMSLFRSIKLNGKTDYKGNTHQLKPGEWTKVMYEFDIPVGATSASVAFSFKDSTSGTTAWVDSPVLYYKAKQ